MRWANVKLYPKQFIVQLQRTGACRRHSSSTATQNQYNSGHYVNLLKQCIQSKNLAHGTQIHTRIIQAGFIHYDIRLLNNTLINMYLKCGELAKSRLVFDTMRDKDVCSWTLIISGYARHGPAQEALDLFHRMQQTQIKPNAFTFSGVISACANLGCLQQGISIHNEIARRGLDSIVSVTNALIDLYGKCGNLARARQLFDEMRNPNVVTWTTLIGAYVHNRMVGEALKMFQAMPDRDTHSWNSMLGGLIRNGYVTDAEELFQKMPRRDAFSWNTMGAGYAQNGFVGEALKILEEMPLRDDDDGVSWNGVIAGFSQSGFDDRALDLYDKMMMLQGSNVVPNSRTFCSVLSACANLGFLKKGIEIHAELVRRGFGRDLFVVSALVDMYAKCGSLGRARELFDKMGKRDVVLWTSMISGYAIHGWAWESLKLFQDMINAGLQPNSVSFLSVLSACSHAGLVEEGFRYFKLLQGFYGMRPSLEHYRCMVDMLCRAGLLCEASRFISKMAVDPDSTVWSCLLSACRLHNNVELGECVAQRMIDLDPTVSSPYVLLSTIYAGTGRWRELEEIRRMMQERDVKKTPGCSWIEVDKQVYTFFGGSTSQSKPGTKWDIVNDVHWEEREEVLQG